MSYFLLIGLISISVAAMAQPQLVVQVIPPQPATSTPGDFVTLVFIVINHGTVQDSYDLQAILPEGFQLIGVSPPSLTLSPGTQENIFITLFVLPGVRAGPHEIKLQATSRSDPAVTVTGVAIIEVLPTAGIVIQPPSSQRAKPGEIVLYIFAVINRGNVFDIFELSARSSKNFPVSVSPGQVQLGPGEHAEVRVTLSIPRATSPGRDILLFRATSLTMLGLFKEERIFTTILPLAYEEVPTFLGLELPTLLTLSSTIEPLAPPLINSLHSQLLITGELSSGLRLSSTIPVSYLPTVSVGAFSLSLSAGPASPDFPPSSFISLLARSSFLFLSPWLSLGLFFSPDELQSAIRTALRSETVGVGLFALRDEKHHSSIFDLTVPLNLKLRLIPIHLFLEAASALRDGLSDSAFRTSFSLAPGSSFLSFDFSRAGIAFGNLASFTSALSFPLALDLLALSTGFMLSFEQTNIAGDPTLPAIFTEKLRINALASSEPFSFGVTLGSEHARGNAVSLVDRLKTELSFHAGVTVKMLSLTFTHAQTQERDNIAMTQTDRLQQSAALTLRPSGGAFLTAILFRSSTNGTETGRITFGFSFGLTSLSLTVVQASFANSSIGLSMTITFNMPFTVQVEAIPVKGRVEGIVFIDKNDNARFDPGEQGVPDLILTLGGSPALSNPQGHFRFPPTKPGTFLLNISELPAFAEPKIKLPLWVMVRLGRVTFVEIPIRQFSAITGVVFNDANRDGIRDLSESGLGNARIILRGRQITQQFVTDPNGSFLFRVLPGEYRLILDITTLPKGFEPTTPGEVSITLRTEEIIRVNFGAAEKLRPIKFAPVADFIFTPQWPKPSETVTFDASSSFDPDGQIVKYQWDFNNDGVIDATGKVVSRSFSAAGDFPVKLIVTDNDGLQNAVTKIVLVQP